MIYSDGILRNIRAEYNGKWSQTSNRLFKIHDNRYFEWGNRDTLHLVNKNQATETRKLNSSNIFIEFSSNINDENIDEYNPKKT